MMRLWHSVTRSRVVSAGAVAVKLLAALTLCTASVASAAGPLEGTFTITPGANPPGSVGSYFRMIQPGGTLAGPYVPNPNSTASDQTYTYLSAGTEGGLDTGRYQPEPSPAFDGSGNSLAARIISPTGFFAANFSAATANVDPQTATAVPAPAISDDGAGNLSGDLRGIGAAWNNQEFNQGSPKPDGSFPGLTAGPTGTYNSVTGAYTLEWTSLIIGGPFDGFTGRWHLEGIFIPSTPLAGTFRITPGANPPGSVGSYFRMIQPGGTLAGPFLPNSSSAASDQTYTYLSPGTDGGLVAGGYQSEPSPGFDGPGNSLSARILTPTGFFGKNFSAATAAIDPQTALAVAAPAISDYGFGNLGGDLRAIGASWNFQEFNQGSPKPNGSFPGITAPPDGTYDSVTGTYTLDWASAIVGGPFDGFTGQWHLEGVFVPRIGISGKSLLLGDNSDPSKKKLKAQSSDPSIGLGDGNLSADDPTIVGATVRIVSIAGGFAASYTLPAANWALLGNPGENKGYKYKNSVGPFTKAQLKPGKLTLAAKGSGLAFSLATDPGPVSVYVTIGRQQFWSQYGGATALKVGKAFKAKNSPVPSGEAP